MAPGKLKELKEHRGFVEERSHSTYCFSVGCSNFVCEEKNDTICMCIDYHQLNKVMIKNDYAVPCTHYLFDELSGASVFYKTTCGWVTII